jgi:hypothetical protein
MNRNVAFNKFGGLYVYQDTFEFMQRAYSEVTQYVSRGLGDKWVLWGCADVGGGNISDGAIVIGSEILKFVGGPPLAYITIESITTQEQFDDNTLKDTYTVRRAKMVSIADANSFPYAGLKRLPLANTSVYDSLDKYHQILKSLINFEPEVILNGLVVTNVTTGPDTFDVSAGLVMFNGQVKSVPAFSGAYPRYLTEAGTWSAGVPGTGLYITFDPHTSQRYTDVLNRAMVKSGKIEMYETLSDRFVAGVGRWEMKGFVLCSALQGRVPLGLWFDGIAVAGVTDAYYATAGPTRKMGSNTTTLTGDQQGTLKIKAVSDDGDGQTSSDKSITRFTINGQTVEGGAVAGTYGAEMTVKLNNDAQAHSNIQPVNVVVYVKRS